MSGESREARELIDALVEISRRIELCAAEQYRLRAEQARLRAQLGLTGYKAGERQDDLPL